MTQAPAQHIEDLVRQLLAEVAEVRQAVNELSADRIPAQRPPAGVTSLDAYRCTRRTSLGGVR